MQQIRLASERGFADHGWLQSRHSFSFADYYDPRHVEFGALRVINEDRVAPGAGFGRHGHRDMEIISYVLQGQLAHADSLGTGAELRAGDVQRMSAGRGVQHSEFNASATEPVHFLQIWITPSEKGLVPEYEQKHFTAADKRGRLCLIVSPRGEDGALRIHQDARVYAGLLDAAESAQLAIAANRRLYVHVARGSVQANGKTLRAGDALLATDADRLQLRDGQDAEVLVFDLPGDAH